MENVEYMGKLLYFVEDFRLVTLRSDKLLSKLPQVLGMI